MYSDIIVIGAGASGLMAAYSAARTLVDAGSSAQVTLLEKMPRAGRKIMITGKGRCNFCNVKDWNSFSSHIRSNPNFVKPSFFNFTPANSLSFFEEMGMPVVVERGDRAYPASYRSADVVDTFVRACHGLGVKIESEVEAKEIIFDGERFAISSALASNYTCDKLIIATGGLSYPTTGSTGDGYAFAQTAGHSLTPLFPALTALVPKGYKVKPSASAHLPQSSPQAAVLPESTLPHESANLPHHIDRALPLSGTGRMLCGIQLKNVAVHLLVDGVPAQSEFGDVDFTDGGIEGPVGFQISRKAVKTIINGSKVTVALDLKPGVPLAELSARVKELWQEVDRDKRSIGLREKEKCRILLGKLMPWDLIPAFRAMNPGITTLEQRGRSDSKLWVNLPTIAKTLKEWKFEIEGFVGYERAVITAGGVNTGEVVAKTLESKIRAGLYFCGEVLDMDADTGGYNMHLAFCTGKLAGESAAKAICCRK